MEEHISTRYIILKASYEFVAIEAQSSAIKREIKCWYESRSGAIRPCTRFVEHDYFYFTAGEN